MERIKAKHQQASLDKKNLAERGQAVPVASVSGGGLPSSGGEEAEGDRGDLGAAADRDQKGGRPDGSLPAGSPSNVKTAFSPGGKLRVRTGQPVAEDDEDDDDDLEILEDPGRTPMKQVRGQCNIITAVEEAAPLPSLVSAPLRSSPVQPPPLS